MSKSVVDLVKIKFINVTNLLPYVDFSPFTNILNVVGYSHQYPTIFTKKKIQSIYGSFVDFD